MKDTDFQLATHYDEEYMSKANLNWLTDQASRGGPLKVTTNNQRIHMDLFRAYTRRERDGVAVLYRPDGKHPQGVALAGEDMNPSRWDHTHGKMAHVWVIWVEPDVREQGVGLAMVLWGRPKLLALGFHTAVCATLHSNPGGANLALAFGVEPVETSYRVKL